MKFPTSSEGFSDADILGCMDILANMICGSDVQVKYSLLGTPYTPFSAMSTFTLLGREFVPAKDYVLYPDCVMMAGVYLRGGFYDKMSVGTFLASFAHVTGTYRHPYVDERFVHRTEILAMCLPTIVDMSVDELVVYSFRRVVDYKILNCQLPDDQYVKAFPKIRDDPLYGILGLEPLVVSQVLSDISLLENEVQIPLLEILEDDGYQVDAYIESGCILGPVPVNYFATGGVENMELDGEIRSVVGAITMLADISDISFIIGLPLSSEIDKEDLRHVADDSRIIFVGEGDDPLPVSLFPVFFGADRYKEVMRDYPSGDKSTVYEHLLVHYTKEEIDVMRTALLLMEPFGGFDPGDYLLFSGGWDDSVRFMRTPQVKFEYFQQVTYRDYILIDLEKRMWMSVVQSLSIRKLLQRTAILDYQAFYYGIRVPASCDALQAIAKAIVFFRLGSEAALRWLHKAFGANIPLWVTRGWVFSAQTRSWKAYLAIPVGAGAGLISISGESIKGILNDVKVQTKKFLGTKVVGNREVCDVRLPTGTVVRRVLFELPESSSYDNGYQDVEDDDYSRSRYLEDDRHWESSSNDEVYQFAYGDEEVWYLGDNQVLYAYDADGEFVPDLMDHPTVDEVD